MLQEMKIADAAAMCAAQVVERRRLISDSSFAYCARRICAPADLALPLPPASCAAWTPPCFRRTV